MLKKKKAAPETAQRKKNKKPQKERYSIPHSLQDTIPVRNLYEDGIFDLGGGRYSKTYSFTDINWSLASEEEQESMFQRYEQLLNGMDNDATFQITINNRHFNRRAFETDVLIPQKDDAYAEKRHAYNSMLLSKIVGSNSITQDLYITVTTPRKSLMDARQFFIRTGAFLSAALAQMGSICTPLNAAERLRILHDFYRSGEQSDYHFDIHDTARKGQDFRDYIAPDGMEIRSDYIKVGEHYVRSLFISDYATFIKDNILSKLMSLPRNMFFTLSIAPRPTDEAIKEVEKILLGVETNIAGWQRRQNKVQNFAATVPYDMEREQTETRELLDDIMTRDQRMYYVTMSMVHMADTPEQLDSDTDAILSEARSCLCQMRTLKLQQLEGLQTTLPYGLRRIQFDRMLSTESLGIFQPFRVQEIHHANGIYYGQNAKSGNMIRIDRSMHNNGNGLILGASGGGKSFMAKSEIAAIALSMDADIIVIDPEREYSKIIDALGGETIRIAADSDNHINAMDLTQGYGDGKNPLLLKSQFLMSLCEQIVEDDLGPKEKSIIDRCAANVYRDYVAEGFQGEIPTLKEFVAELQLQPEPEAQSLALAMELFTGGSLNTFAKESNVDTTSHLICYDILDLGKQLTSVGLLVMLDAIWNRIASNRSQGRRTYIYIDELYLLFKHPYSANFLAELWKRCRKFNGFITGITQNIDEVLQSDEARLMLSNSEFIILLNQAPKDRDDLAGLMHISPEQMVYITDVGVGRGLIKAGRSMVPFVNEFPKENPLYPLMSTKPGEG